MTRLRSSLLHLALSAVVGLALFVFFWFKLYPAPIFQAVGGVEIFLMLLAIDIMLGPILTLIVWKKEWEKLRKDLAFIAFLQLTALCYGIHTLWVARPVFIAALGARFDLICATDVAEAEVASFGKPLPLLGPKWVGIKRTTDPKERERIMFASLGGVDYGHFPQHHQPIENMRDIILAEALPIVDLKKNNPGEEALIDAWLAKRGVDERSVLFQGLKARARDMAVIVDAKTAAVIGIAPFKPWP